MAHLATVLAVKPLKDAAATWPGSIPGRANSGQLSNVERPRVPHLREAFLPRGNRPDLLEADAMEDKHAQATAALRSAAEKRLEEKAREAHRQTERGHTYDDLLESRVKQLREIDDVLADIRRYCAIESSVLSRGVVHRLNGLRQDITEMIRVAEAEHAAF